MNLVLPLRRIVFAGAIALVAPCAFAQVLYTPSGQVGPSANGNVGIGTASPAGLLDVGPTFYTGQGTFVVRPQNSNVEGGEIELLGAGGKPIWVVDNYDTKLRLFTFSNYTDNTSQVQIFNPQGTAGLWVQGNLGIGTLAPQRRLHLYEANGYCEQLWEAGAVAAANIGRIWRWGTSPDGAFSVSATNSDLTAATGVMTLNQYGYVGLGVGSPRRRLHLFEPNGWCEQLWEAGAVPVSSVGRIWRWGTSPSGQFSLSATNGDLTAGIGAFTATSSGNVGIGTTNPTNKLEVNGTIRAKEVIVETTGWSDYVFAPDYRLAPLSEVEAHIAANGHLPGIPSAAEVAERGVSVSDMQAKLLAKVEELTLHVILLSKKVEVLESENAALKAHR